MATPGNREKSRWGQRAVYFITLLAVFLFIGFILVANFGNVNGEEFSPSTFKRRQFYYYEVPWIHVQVSPIFRDDSTDEVSTYLKSTDWLTLTPKSAEPWHLVSGYSGSQARQRGDASILTHYLDAVDADGSHYWEDWSQANAAHAKVLWQEIAEVARQQHYLLIPTMMALAEQSLDTPPADLASALNRHIVEHYRDWARNEEELGHDQAARTLYEAWLAREPGAEEAQSALDRLPPATS